VGVAIKVKQLKFVTMNKEVQYVIQGFLLALFAIIAVDAVQSLYHYSKRVSPVKNGNAVVIDGDDVQDKPIVTDKPGYTLFQANCASCHQVTKRLVGPALAEVEERGPWSDRKQLYAWIHNPARYMKSEPYTAGLFKEYGGIMMQAFPNLSEKDIDAILDYIKSFPAPYYHYDVVAFR